jgi:hypothetical protein
MNIYAHRPEGSTSWGLFGRILVECLLAGLFTAWAYACSLDGRFSAHAFMLPAVFEISSSVGLIMGALASPFVFLAMRHLRFFIRAGAYLLVMIAAALFEIWLRSGFFVAFAMLLGICVLCMFTRRSRDV